jgi:DNA-binding NtrC family response regulator
MKMLEHNKILLVDDEINICKSCQRVFDREGYVTEFALSGKEALEKAFRESFDLIITDLKMPDINGIEVIKEIKQKQPEVPIIMITGYPSVPTAVEAIKLGADDYIPKPLKPDEILRAVDRAIEKAQDSGEKTREKPIPMQEGIIDKEQVMEVLNRASRDNDFWVNLLENGSLALKDYNLSDEAKAAIVSGDINWIEKNIGKLTETQLKYLELRLQREKW